MLTYLGNKEKTHDFNMSVFAKAVSIESRLEDRAIEDIEEVINEVNKAIQSRNKLIADKTEGG